MHAQFLQAIIEAPDDDTPRLVYADWLEEYGGDLARAEFIRVQMELEHFSQCEFLTTPHDKPCYRTARSISICCRHCVLHRRERELLDVTAHWSGWTHQAFDHLACDVGVATDGHSQRVILYSEHKEHLGVFRCDFRRGFVERISLSSQDWLAHADELVKAAPIREVELTTLPEIVFVHGINGKLVFESKWPRIKFTMTPRPETHALHWAGSVVEVPAAENIAIGEFVARTPDGRVRRTPHRDGAVGIAVRSSENNFVRVHLLEPFPAD